MAKEAQRIFVICGDLFFSGSIREAGASQGSVFEFLSSAEKFEQALDNFRAVLFLVDLHHPKLGGETAYALVKKLKAHPENRDAYAIAWGAHTEPELLKGAEKAGFDKAMPRSSFVREMPAIVQRAASRIRTSE